METIKRITRFAPWQAGKVSAILYFGMGVLFAVPMGLISWLTPPSPNKAGPLFFVLLPFLYGLAGLVFVPLTCWLYNVAVKYVGGIEVTIATDSEE